MTFLELCVIARQECSIQGDGPSSVVSQTGLLKKVVDWVAAADMDVQRKHIDWNFLRATHPYDIILNTTTITKPTDHGAWDNDCICIDHGTYDGRKLIWMPYQEYRQIVSLKSTQQPYLFTVLPSGVLTLAYPSDGAYTFSGDYWKAPQKMTANTSEPLIPAAYQRIIIERAKMWFFEDIESERQFLSARDSYDRLMQELEDQELPNRQGWARYEADEMVVRPV